jgi:prevent-host-death family protein
MSTMPTVGVRELKAHLSHYLSRVRDGERFAVTDRGRTIARLAPADESPVPEWVSRAVSEKRASYRGGKPLGLHPRVKAKGRPTSAIVIEDRR